MSGIANRTDYPRNSSLGDLFAERVAIAPNAPAVRFGAVALTYRELDLVTNSLAAALRERGAGLGTFVAIHADRDLSVVVGMLATIKAGAAYLPLETAHPVARLRKILAEAQPVVLLSGQDPRAAGDLGLPVFAADRHLDAATRDPLRFGRRVDGRATAGDLAYVMYTSGSSGLPKGTCVTHRNVVRLVRNTNYVRFEPGDRIAQISNAAFDAATFEVWGALLNGGELVGFDRDTILSPARFAAAVRESAISTMVIATPLFNQLAAHDPQTFAGISQLFVGGDVIAVDQARSVAARPECALVNGYGPTECTTFATAHRVTPAATHGKRVPIGCPVANTTCYVLDDMLQPQPAGVAGQLYIGGDGVARGYLGQPGLTADRFVPDPFAAEPGARMYATGDIVGRLPDGALDFLGRADFQVKMRGFRVEIGEIDTTLLEHPEISEAVTILADDQSGDRLLASYYISAGQQSPDEADVRAFLRQRLPEYMIPSRLIRLPELPKNANMKIDRAKLASLAASWPAAHHGHEAPEEAKPLTARAETADTVLESVAAIIARLLKIPAFGVAENFFESGGHSLLATRLLAELRTQFRVDMRLNELFDDPTPSGIAAYLRQHAEDAGLGAGRRVPESQP